MNVTHTFSDRSRPLILGTALAVGFFASLLWLLSEVAEWVFAVLKAAR